MLVEILGTEIVKIRKNRDFKCPGGFEKCYFEPIWERNFVNVNFLQILVMQANLIAYEIAEVEILSKNNFPDRKNSSWRTWCTVIYTK